MGEAGHSRHSTIATSSQQENEVRMTNRDILCFSKHVNNYSQSIKRPEQVPELIQLVTVKNNRMIVRSSFDN